jgi:chaperonin GroEL
MAPSFEDHKRHLLDDLATATGATVVSHDTVPLKDADASVLGFAKRVVSTKDKTVFTGVGGDPEHRISLLKAERKIAEEKFDQELLDQRIALLSGKIASILVGGQTESEVEEKKFRVDDAVAATKAALLEGVLPGGGITLYHAPITAKTDGAKLLASVLKEPFNQLLKNSALDIDVSKVTNAKGMGVNVKTGKIVNLVDEGIVDPYAVTKQALITAVSLGVVGLTAGALIVEEKEESK